MIFACYSPIQPRAAQKWPLSIVNPPTAVLAEALPPHPGHRGLRSGRHRNSSRPPAAFALFIGFIIAFIIMVEAPLTMACINPARDLGPRIAITMPAGSAAFPGVGRLVGVDLGPSSALGGGAAWSFIFVRFLTPRPWTWRPLESSGPTGDPTPGGDPHLHGSDEGEDGDRGQRP